LARAEPLSALARNACVASVFGELAGVAVVVLFVESNMAFILWAFPAEDFRTRRAGRMSLRSQFAEPLTERQCDRLKTAYSQQLLQCNMAEASGYNS
jgi:hypothetical protein